MQDDFFAIVKFFEDNPTFASVVLAVVGLFGLGIVIKVTTKKKYVVRIKAARDAIFGTFQVGDSIRPDSEQEK